MIEGEFDDEEEIASPGAVERISAFPGQPCPKTGEWYAVHLNNQSIQMQHGDPMPGPEHGPTGQVIWYYREGGKV